MEIGIDCIEISRIDREVLSNTAFLERIFTPDEIRYCSSKAKPSQHFAVRFAGKEALIKALSHYNIRVPLNQIEILNDTKGIPFARILDKNCTDFEIKISLSHSGEMAIAFVIIC